MIVSLLFWGPHYSVALMVSLWWGTFKTDLRQSSPSSCLLDSQGTLGNKTSSSLDQQLGFKQFRCSCSSISISYTSCVLTLSSMLKTDFWWFQNWQACQEPGSPLCGKDIALICLEPVVVSFGQAKSLVQHRNSQPPAFHCHRAPKSLCLGYAVAAKLSVGTRTP